MTTRTRVIAMIAAIMLVAATALGFSNVNFFPVKFPETDGSNGQVLQTDGSGTLSWASGTATAWDDIGNPDADKTITFGDNEITTLSFADTNEDMLTVSGIGAFGDVSVMRVQSATGNPTNGTVLEVVSHDANVDPLVVSSSGQAGVLVVSQDGSVDITGDLDISGTATLGTWAVTTLNATTLNVSGASALTGNVTLDDGTGASPSLTFTDGSDETAVLSKTDSGRLGVTTLAADGLDVLTGNIRIGNGTPGTASMDGEDAYIEGELEVDGSIQLDGAVTMASTLSVAGAITTTNTVALSENVTFTVAADEYFKIDANSTANTGTAGVLDIDIQSATNTHKGVTLTYQLEDGATQAYGIYSDVDDDTSGAEVIDLYHAVNSAGTNATTRGLVVANTIDDGYVATLGAAAQAIVVDATTTLSTSTAGAVMDAAFRSLTTNSQAINLDVESDVAGGASEIVEGIHIQMDDDANTSTDEIHGIEIDTDGNGTGLQHAVYVGGTAGIDAALYAANGYVRVGTGATPDVTPGDDDVFIEGTIEVDGASRFDGDAVFNATVNTAADSELTISSGAITATKSFHNVDTESDGASDDLDTINGGSDGDVLVLIANNTGRTVVCKDGTGNLNLSGDFSLDNTEDSITLIFDGSNWLEMATADNGS